MAAIATAATAFPDPGGTGIKGGGTGKCVKAWLLATEVAEDGVRLNDELSGPKAVTIGLKKNHMKNMYYLFKKISWKNKANFEMLHRITQKPNFFP